MHITDQFRVPVPVDDAWRVLLDVERIAPCLPGAQLQEIEGEDYRGVVKIKVGPITAQYRGAARIVEADEEARRIVLQADGRDARGQGNASARITVTMAADGDATAIDIDTELAVTGKVAQFGRGVMADVSSKLLAQFARSLETDVLAGGGPEVPQAGRPPAADPPVSPVARSATAAPTGSDPASVRVIESHEPAPIDVVATAGGVLAKRLVPVVIVAVAVAGLMVWLVAG